MAIFCKCERMLVIQSTEGRYSHLALQEIYKKQNKQKLIFPHMRMIATLNIFKLSKNLSLFSLLEKRKKGQKTKQKESEKNSFSD